MHNRSGGDEQRRYSIHCDGSCRTLVSDMSCRHVLLGKGRVGQLPQQGEDSSKELLRWEVGHEEVEDNMPCCKKPS